MTQTLSREKLLKHIQVAEGMAALGNASEAEQDLLTIYRMALSHADAYERGQRDMAAAAVKEVSGHLSRLDESLNEGLMTDADLSDDDAAKMNAQLDCIKVIENRLLSALRALSPGEWVAVPAPRPISEAPKDGTRFYGVRNGKLFPDVCWGRHDENSISPWGPYHWRGMRENPPTHFIPTDELDRALIAAAQE